MHVAGLCGEAEALLVEVTHHQHGAGAGILNHTDDQAVVIESQRAHLVILAGIPAATSPS